MRFGQGHLKKATAVAFFVFCTAALARDAVVAKHFMVAAAHPLAAQAGYDMLERGGSVLDAAVAVQAMLGLVEPESSGIAGGAFLLHWSAAEKRLRSYDGRETAPALARPDRFLKNGEPLGFREAAIGGRSVGVPGVLRMLELAHGKHGRLPWAELFKPAIDVAENGFVLSPRLHAQLAREKDVHLYEGRAAGERVFNREYGATLRQIAAKGAGAFYEGAIADDIVRAVRANAKPGDLSAADLALYRAREREPLCAPYRAYRVCSMGPPSSGGVGVLEILGILERTRFAAAPAESVEALHLFSEAGKLAYADRARYLGDPDFVAVPVARLLSPEYLAKRASLIGERASRRALPGDLEHGTSHFSIVAANGDALAMTTTVEATFGSHILVRGFLLNNELTDFDFVPGGANEVRGGKRPRSSMAPAMVFQDQMLQMLIGSPGGSMIINYVAKALVATLDWQLDIQAAIDLPNFGSRNGPTLIERGMAYEGLAKALTDRGHDVQLAPLESGLHGIERTPQGWRGGADPRREGVARGR